MSNFVVYDGDAFPAWRGQFIVGTVEATELYRMEVRGDTRAQSEVLIQDLARIRDMGTGPDGLIYLPLEHASGSRIVRLVPDVSA